MPLQCDIRDEEAVKSAIEQTVKQFGGIDILVNNASAINLSGTEDISMKRFDLMHQINTRGTFMTSKYAIPHLKKAANPHILNLSPPLIMTPNWFAHHSAYTMAKYGMSMCVLGMAEELKEFGIAVNAIWPRTAIWTAAMAMLGGGAEIAKNCRKPEILSDSAYAILSKNSKAFTGNFCIDETLLRDEGITDFEQYAVAPGNPLLPDGFIPKEMMEGLIALNNAFQMASGEAKQQSDGKQSGNSTEKIFNGIKSILNEDLRKELNAVLAFVVSGQNWLIDANVSRPMKVEKAEANNADVTLITDDETFAKIAKGEVKATNAFMSGKLKVKGNIAIAMKLEKLFSTVKSKL